MPLTQSASQAPSALEQFPDRASWMQINTRWKKARCRNAGGYESASGFPLATVECGCKSHKNRPRLAQGKDVGNLYNLPEVDN